MCRRLLGCAYSGKVLFGGSYSLKLTSQPTHSVAVELVVLDAVSGLKSPETHLSLHFIYFSKVDWNIERIIFVNATTPMNNDLSVTGSHNFVVV